MKLSIYNSYLPLTDASSMLFNAATDKFLIYKKELEMLLKQSPGLIEQQAPVFYKQLSENGFIVDDRKDEVAEMVELGKKICNDDSCYHLIINPTTNCNFNCWYCYEHHSSDAKMNSAIVGRTIKLINRIYKDSNVKRLHISFFGGEPLLYYKDTVEPIINAIREKECNDEKLSVEIGFTSNAYLVNNHIIDHLKEGDESIVFQITLDGGREQHNLVRYSTSGKGSYDRIIKNIKWLLSVGIRVGLRINYTKENLSSILNILKDFEDVTKEQEALFAVDFQKVWQEEELENGDKQVEEIIAAFRDRFQKVSDFYNHCDGFRNPCYADKLNECVINYNGNVYKCTARDFTQENRLGYLSDDGSIIWDDLEFVSNRTCKKLNREMCNKCRIFPICGGGCAQNSIEYSGSHCVRFSSELGKDKVVLKRFYNNVVRNSFVEGHKITLE